MTSDRPRRTLVHALALAALLGAPASAMPTPPDCATRVLADLGWRFETAPGDAVLVHAGTPCDRADLAAAQAAGDLVVRLPARMEGAARARALEALLRHPATLCAYGFQVGDATRRAVDRLVANRGFRFSWLQVGWIGFGPTGSARDGWEPLASFGRAYRPRAGNARAIDAFYRGQVRAECGVGRQVAQYATLAELFGTEGFDAAFAADEIVIGTFNQLNRSGSILQGAAAGAFVRDGLARKAARQGRQAFMGVPGFIYHVFDRSTLDDIHNQAENFVVYDVSADAADALRRHGGFAHYNARSREAWELARTLDVPGRRRYFERLLFFREPALRATLAPAERATVARIDALLGDPFFQGFEVYVHRQGVRPVAFHIARLLDRNPRTPFRIELALHNVHTTLFERWLAHRQARCPRGMHDAASRPTPAPTSPWPRGRSARGGPFPPMKPAGAPASGHGSRSIP